MTKTQNPKSARFSGRTWFRPVLLCLTFAGLCATLSAQTTGAGTISGTVTDPTGGVVPSATVTVKNTATGTERPLATNEAGIYVAQFLQPGAYEITVNKQGFSKTVRTGITVQVGQSVTLDFALSVQTTTEAVTVSGDASLVDVQKTEMSQVVTQTQKENLPIAGRRWEGFAFMTPNVTSDGGTGLVSYRGISGLYNQSAVDGTNNSQAFFSETKGRTTLFYVYSMDSIQEFQVASSNYSAELGQAAGGIVNAVTKSGTSAIHGDLFYYLRYPSLNAFDPIQKAAAARLGQTNLSQPIHQQQQFGASVGGPVIKDKLFYFFTYEGSRKVNPITYTSTTFNGPQACLAAIPSATCAAANAYVASQLGGFPRVIAQDLVFGKLDYQVNSANHIGVSFDGLNFRGPNAYTTGTTVSNSSLTQNGNAITRERIFVANWDSTIRPTITNSFRFQWSRDLEQIAANSTGPSVGITNYFGYGLPNALPRPAFPDEHRLQFADVLSSIHGKHTIKAGVDVNRIHELLINLFQGGGVYTYSGANNYSNWVADVAGVNLGDGFTGRHFTTFVQVTDPVTGVGKDDFYDTDFAGFVEDTWKPRANLTLNLGVRYDLQYIPPPTKPNMSTPLTTLYTSTINIDKNNFAPRIGLAWNFAKNTVLRVGYGIFYAKTSNSTYYATRVENGVIQQTFNCNPTTCPALKFPNLIFTPPGGAPVAPFTGALVPLVVPFTPPSGTQTARGQTPDWVNPLIHEGEVTVEHQLPWDMSVMGSYVVSRGLRLPMFYDSNIAPSTTTRSYDVTNLTGTTQSSFTVPFYTTRLNPTTGPVLTGASDVNSWYNSLVVTLRRRMSKGLEVIVNYTLAKAIDGGQVPGQFGTFNGTDTPIDPYNRKLEYAPSDLDQRQRMVGSVVWIPSYPKTISNKPLRLILDGYALSSIVTIGTGQPVTGVISGNVAGAIAGGPTGGAVNNSGTATGGRSPGLPRNSYVGPGATDIDFRLSRDFKFTERVKLSLLGEAFNLFNFTNFYAVNTTQYTYTAAGSGACAGHTNGCLIPQATFLTPSSSSNNLIGARQLQISARITF